MKFTTLLVGDKYPVEYAYMLADSLGEWGYMLDCYTDDIELCGKTKTWVNSTGPAALSFKKIVPAMHEGVKVPLHGWWYIMIFYNYHYFKEPILFVDLDTIFLNDPAPIMTFIEKAGKSDIYHSAPKGWGKKEPALQAGPLALMTGNDKELWETFCEGNVSTDPENPISAAFLDLNAKRPTAIWPRNYMVGYKPLVGWPGWEDKAKSLYDEYGLKDIIAVTFSGDPRIEQVVIDRHPYYHLFEDAVNRWI